jgi:hypothetical protein
VTITNGYCTEEQFRSYVGTIPADRQSQVHDAINTASRAIDLHCGRVFFDSGSATARVYSPFDQFAAWVDDFSTTTGLVVKVDEDNDGAFETTWTSSDYEVEPIGGVVHGVSGWPFRMLRAVGSYRFRVGVAMERRQTLQVTARWGWAAVPEPVRQACLQMAAELYRRKDAPFGIAQTVDFGPIRLSADAVRAVSSSLEPFRIHAIGFR